MYKQNNEECFYEKCSVHDLEEYYKIEEGELEEILEEQNEPRLTS